MRLSLLTEVTEPEELFDKADALTYRMLGGSAKALRLKKIAVDIRAEVYPKVGLLAQAVLFEYIEKFDRTTAFLDRGRTKQTQRG